MTVRLCVIGHHVPGKHRDGCTDTDCRSCVPAMATHGLQVCSWHEKRTRDALRDLPGLWADLGDPRRGRTSTNRSTDDGSPMLIGDAHRNARSQIRACLVGWCMILHEDYALSLPADTVRAMAHHVAVQAGRLLNSEHADQLVAELLGHTDEDGDRHEGAAPTAWRLARPASSRTWRILCDCGERVPVEADGDVIMRCRGCDAWGVLSWWIERSAPNTDEPVTAAQAVGAMWDTYRMRVTLTQIAHWSSRGKLAAVGTADPTAPGRPANLYRIRTILRLALDARESRTA